MAKAGAGAGATVWRRRGDKKKEEKKKKRRELAYRSDHRRIGGGCSTSLAVLEKWFLQIGSEKVTTE